MINLPYLTIYVYKFSSCYEPYWILTQIVAGSTNLPAIAIKRLFGKSFKNIANNMANPIQKASVQPTRALKWGLGICTAIYVVAFPVLLAMAFLCSMLALERPKETPLTISIIAVAMSSLPLSAPVSIYLMWSKYFRNQLKRALVFAGLPFYVLTAVLLICGVLDAITRHG